MRWWRRRTPDIAGPTVEELTEMNDDQSRKLADARKQWPEVRSLAQRLHLQLEENHFAERIRAGLGG